MRKCFFWRERIEYLSMKKYLLTLSIGVLFPVIAFALDYSNHTGTYKDAASFTASEKAGISLLTSLNVVQGNPNGRFEAGRTLNRAEFMKIAMQLQALVSPATKPDTTGLAVKNCFPDVSLTQWFGSDICRAKKLGIVTGDLDGSFHPGRPVNYVEALKILTGIYTLPLTHTVGMEEWYEQYVRAATAANVQLSGMQPGTSLTRGQMARLAAAFHANSQNELALYRQAEKGVAVSSSSSSTSSAAFCGGIAGFQCGAGYTCIDNPNDSCNPANGGADCGGMCVPAASSSSSVSSSSLSSGSASSTPVTRPDFPARSRFLMLGARSEPIASAQFFANLEPVLVRGARVKLTTGIDSIDAMYMVDTSGSLLGQLYLDGSDTTNKTWRGTFASPYYEIPKAGTRTLGVEVRLKERNGGGTVDQLIQVDTLNLSMQGVWSEQTSDSASPTFTFPRHQSVQGRITSVANALDATGTLPVGSNQLVAGFTFTGVSIAPTKVQLEELVFAASKPEGMTLSSVQLGAQDTEERVSCSVTDSVISCPNISVGIGTLQDGKRTLRLYATVGLVANMQNPFLQISLNEPGAIGSNGAVRWTDGTGHYNWVELDQPLARSTNWK
ncbi:MAG: hypothetical protein JWM56_20 [Candidatus Peribacteria bacterium]|nr:hypothetical protein [Candidatus Peribacteria bacterium]